MLSLAHFEAFWDLVGSLGTSWSFLVALGTFWNLLKPLGTPLKPQTSLGTLFSFVEHLETSGWQMFDNKIRR